MLVAEKVRVLVALIVSILGGLAGGFIGARLGGNGFRSLIPTRVTVVPSKTSEPVVAAAAAAVPSVVNIDVSAEDSNTKEEGLPDTHPDVPAQGNGSGVVYKKNDGGVYIITNNHVVDGAKSITVRDPGGQRWDAKLVGRDPETDIAIVEIEADLPTMELGDSEKLAVGQTVVAIGSPFGLEHSVTSGVVSALGRSLPDFSTSSPGTYPLVDVIQTDAAINPGNSGGALVDRSGRLVGINTAIYSDSGSSGGIGFAIPTNAAIKAADQLISKGKVEHPFLGVIGQTVNADVAKAKKLPVEEGALVQDFSSGSTAKASGIKVGDLIVALDGTPIRSMDDLILQVRRKQVDEKVDLTLYRDGKRQVITVTVGEKPAELDTESQVPTLP
ncbi:MAG: trypsin-like peptidase domain-containing protein [Coriobacteriales bacterium]|nr:trypsin-like peptidase domain-containing protein [Coriobacteriales bacterium]